MSEDYPEPKYTGPKLDLDSHYRLIVGKEYVTQLSPLKTSKKREEARALSARYLVRTVWQWWDLCLFERINPNEASPHAKETAPTEELPPPDVAAAFKEPDPEPAPKPEEEPAPKPKPEKAKKPEPEPKAAEKQEGLKLAKRDKDKPKGFKKK